MKTVDFNSIGAQHKIILSDNGVPEEVCRELEEQHAVMLECEDAYDRYVAADARIKELYKQEVMGPNPYQIDWSKTGETPYLSSGRCIVQFAYNRSYANCSQAQEIQALEAEIADAQRRLRRLKDEAKKESTQVPTAGNLRSITIFKVDH